MNIDHVAITAGIDIGLLRSLRTLRGFQPASLDALRDGVRVVIVPALERFSPPRPWGTRGQAVFAELGALASVARSLYKDDGPLSVAVAYDILEPLGRFLNSWVHE